MIRAATEEDLEWVRELWRLWMEEFAPPFIDQIVALNAQCDLFRRIVGGEQRGVALVIPEDALSFWAGNGDVVHDFGLYVAPWARKQGKAASLMDATLTEARKAGYRRMLASPYVSNEFVVDWLGRQGWEPVQLVMSKEI